MSRGKNYKKSVEVIDREQQYPPKEAIKMVKNAAYAKFDESVEVHFNLGIDPRHAEQQLRGTFVLPHGTGKTVIVAAIVPGDKISQAESAGADHVGSEDLIEKIEKGWLDFDLLISTPSLIYTQ